MECEYTKPQRFVKSIYIYMIERPLGSISSLKSARLELDI